MKKTIKLTGPGLNSWFAEEMVKDYGAEGARERCAGPMLAAVEAVIAEQARASTQSTSAANSQGDAA